MPGPGEPEAIASAFVRGEIWNAAVRLLSRLPLDFEEERKRLLYGSVVLVATLMLLVFGGYHLVAGPLIEGWINLLVGTILLVTIVGLRRTADGRLYYRSFMIIFLALFVFFGTLGGAGERALWALTLPAVAMFIVGVRWGVILSTSLFAAWMLLFTLPTAWTGAAEYTPGFRFRFTGVYLTIFFLAVFVEQVRHKYSQAMRVHQQRLQRQNEILSENVRLKEEVERVSRHDLKTPLNSILAQAQLLLGDPRLATPTRRAVGEIEQAAHRLMNMINLSLDLFRMEQGSYELRPHRLNLRALIERVLLDLRGLAGAHRVACALSTEGWNGERFPVNGDEMLSYSMLGNLVRNAIEAAPRGGTVTVSLAAAEGGVLVRIHNAGAVPVSLRERFFEKYATEGKSGGSGLGTYSARLMAETQGATIRLHTSEGAGTTVTVCFPLAPPPSRHPDSAREVEGAVPGDAANRSRRVLVVDDDAASRRLITHLLSGAGCLVDEAADGAEALALYGESSHEIVILNAEAAGLNQAEVVSAIRARERVSGPGRAGIVALVPGDDPEGRLRAERAGCDRCLAKPVSRAALLAAMQP